MLKNYGPFVAKLKFPEGIRYESKIRLNRKKNKLKEKVLSFYENFKSLNLRNWIEYQIFVKHNKPKSFTQILKDANGNYILPPGFSSVKEVGKTKKTKPHINFDSIYNGNASSYGVDGIESRMTYLNKVFPKEFNDSNAFYVEKDKFEEIQKKVGVTYFQPLKLKK